LYHSQRGFLENDGMLQVVVKYNQAPTDRKAEVGFKYFGVRNQ
jgi:hypothetical protein